MDADGASPELGSPRARAALRGRGRDREVPRRVRDRAGRRRRLVRAVPRRAAPGAGALARRADARRSRPTRTRRARERARSDARERRRRQAVRRAHRRRRRHARRSPAVRALADPATSPNDPASFPSRREVTSIRNASGTRLAPRRDPPLDARLASAARPPCVRRERTNTRRVSRRPSSGVSTPLRVPDRPTPRRASPPFPMLRGRAGARCLDRPLGESARGISRPSNRGNRF